MYMGIATDGRLASGHGRRTDGGQIAQKNLDPGGVAPSGSKNPICACLEFKTDRLKRRPTDPSLFPPLPLGLSRLYSRMLK